MCFNEQTFPHCGQMSWDWVLEKLAGWVCTLCDRRVVSRVAQGAPLERRIDSLVEALVVVAVIPKLGPRLSITPQPAARGH